MVGYDDYSTKSGKRGERSVRSGSKKTRAAGGGRRAPAGRLLCRKACWQSGGESCCFCRTVMPRPFFCPRAVSCPGMGQQSIAPAANGCCKSGRAAGGRERMVPERPQGLDKAPRGWYSEKKRNARKGKRRTSHAGRTGRAKKSIHRRDRQGAGCLQDHRVPGAVRQRPDQPGDPGTGAGLSGQRRGGSGRDHTASPYDP